MFLWWIILTKIGDKSGMHVFTTICVFICCIISGCNQQEKNTSINFGLATLPSNLDPLYATDAVSSRIDRLIYQRLVYFDEKKRAVPGITNWQKLSDTHYRFTLNDTAKPFHNGNAISSADIKATYDFVLNAGNASPHRTSLNLIKEIKIYNAKSVDFYLSRPDPLFPGYLALGIVPKKLIDADYAFNQHPLGSGAYKFIAESDDGKIQLQRQSDNLMVQFVFVPDPTVRVLKLLRGELDILQNDIQPELINYLSHNENIAITKVTGSSFSYIGFNLQDQSLKKQAVRLAIAHGIDREEIIQYVFSESARKANGILPPSHWAANANLIEYEYDPKKSIQLLNQAGYSKSNPLVLSYKTSSDPFRLRIATIFQHQLKKIGIQLDIRSYDWGTFFGDIKAGRFQLYSLAWVGINTPDIFRYTSHSLSIPPQGANRGRFFDEKTDQLIEHAESQSSLIKQAEIYSELQAHLLQQLPYIPLWYEDHVVIKNKRVKNYMTTSTGNYDGLKNVSL